MRLTAITLRILFVALAGFHAALGADVRAEQQSAEAVSLPGDKGPRVEYVGKPPNGNEVVEVFVYEKPEHAAVGAVRPQRFPQGVQRLKFDLRLKDMPRTGLKVHYQLLTTNGPLAMEDKGLVTIVWMRTLGVASMDFELFPKGGQFPDGPYQLKLFMNDAQVAILNWSVGGT